MPTETTAETTPGVIPGLGDTVVPWAGNPGYDATSYEWDLFIDPAEGTLVATTIMYAVATGAADGVAMDYSGPSPEYVGFEGVEVDFDYQPPKLWIEADVAEDQEFAVEVRFEGTPEPLSGLGPGRRRWIHVRDHLYTSAVLPGDTASWAPLNDSPLDPAQFSVRIETPPGATAFASGVRQDAATAQSWETDVAITEFGLVAGDMVSREVESVSSPTVTVSVPTSLSLPSEVNLDASLPEILSHHESFLGPFPFPSLHLAGVQGLNGANSTPGLVMTGFFDVRLMAHELAHQWIGGSVGTAASRDAWWREGIPEYLTFVWVAERANEDVEMQMARVHESIGSSTRVLLEVDEPQDRADDATYSRGALAVHALRSAMGDEAFRTGLQDFTAQWAGASATTEDLIATMQRHTEVALDSVASAWIAQEAVPPLP